MLGQIKLLLLAAVTTISCTVNAGQFYLFPIPEIEGLQKVENKVHRALIDKAFVERFLSKTGDTGPQNYVLQNFQTELSKTYPGSVVRPDQVGDIAIPGSNPTYGIQDCYAVVLGITRASIYETKKGGNIEVLIPVTLNLQIIRPSLAKLVFSSSNTFYLQFRFSETEYKNGSKDVLIRNDLVKAMNEEVSSLLGISKQGFNPKDVPIKLIDKDGNFFIAEKGFEAGFQKGDAEAKNAKGEPIFFDVIYVDAGYTVVSVQAGQPNANVKVGDTYSFLFEKVADDSRKPRIAPVVSNSSAKVNAIADYLAKDIGFKAGFQVTPVDVNFAQTKQLIITYANRPDWKKIPSMSETFGGREDPPDYFLRLNTALSPVAILKGAGGTETSERFHTLVSAQVVDYSGKIIYSELGDDDFEIKRVSGAGGLSQLQAEEVSLKNASRSMSKSIINSFKFQPTDFKITKVDKERVWVEGLAIDASMGAPTFSIMHPLNAKMNGKPTVIDLDVGSSTAGVAIAGSAVGLPYSIVTKQMPAPAVGDFVRVTSPVKPAGLPIMECTTPPFIASGNAIEVQYFPFLVQHAVYRSSKFTSYINEPKFYENVNDLLKLGLFNENAKIVRNNQDLCVVPGYLIKESNAQCDDPTNCKGTVLTGMQARIMKGSELVKIHQVGIQTEFSGFQSEIRKEFYGYKQLSNSIPLSNQLTNKLNTN